MEVQMEGEAIIDEGTGKKITTPEVVLKQALGTLVVLREALVRYEEVLRVVNDTLREHGHQTDTVTARLAMVASMDDVLDGVAVPTSDDIDTAIDRISDAVIISDDDVLMALNIGRFDAVNRDRIFEEWLNGGLPEPLESVEQAEQEEFEELGLYRIDGMCVLSTVDAEAVRRRLREARERNPRPY